MKKWMICIAMLVGAITTMEAQQVGQLYDRGGVRGIVVKTTADCRPAVLMSLGSCNERYYENKELQNPPMASHPSDGRVNMQAIEQYKAQYGGSFPAYEWCRSLGPGWYLPSVNEVYDAWIVALGGEEALDNYDQDRMMALREVIQQVKGDKVTWDKNQPIPWMSSTLEQMTGGKKNKTVYVLRTVGLKESKGSTAGSLAIIASPFGRSRKGGKISTLYAVPYMKGSDAAGVWRAFYRLEEDAYAGGIYEAPQPTKGATSNIGAAPNTHLVAADAAPAPAPAPAPALAPAPAPTVKTAPAPTYQASAPKAAPAPTYQAPTRAQAPAPAPASQPAYQQPAPSAPQPVIYANNTGWDIIIAPGQDIQCKVIRVGQKEIEYKKAGFLDGPTYTISRKKAERIIYADGREEEVKISTFDFLKKK